MKRVYISGKIGEEVLSEATRQKFEKVEEALRARGYDVFNPTTSGLGSVAEIMSRTGLSMFRELEHTKQMGRHRKREWYDCILLLDLEALSWCDAIYIMPDWVDSPGAIAEQAYAKAIGLEILAGHLGVF